MVRRLTTAQLIRKLCTELGHEEAAAPCVKKLVQENWLERVDDLQKVPRSRLERWGMPLKLVEELVENLVQLQAGQELHGIQAFVNYNIRPRIQQTFGSQSILTSLREDAERRQQPQVWATKKLQRSFRRRQQRRLRAQVDAENAALLLTLDQAEVSSVSQADKDALREKRAVEKIRRLVRGWKTRKKQGGNSTRASFGKRAEQDLAKYHEMCPSGPGSAVVGIVARHIESGEPKDCEVSSLLKRFAKKIGRQWEEIIPYAHRIVSFNWIEHIEDLDCIEDSHWDEWEVPELLVVLIKGEVAANSRPGLRQAACSCCTGTASCCIGDFFGFCCDFVSGLWSYSDDQEQQRKRKEEQRAHEEEQQEKSEPSPPAKVKMRPLLFPAKTRG